MGRSTGHAGPAARSGAHDLTVRGAMSENDLHAPLPRNEEDILAEFGRIRLEYNRLSKQNPEHTPRRMALKARYRRLDRRYGRILARKRSAGGGNGYAEKPEKSKPDAPREPRPPAFTPLDNVPLDSGLAADDPFAADSSKDSLFGDTADSSESGSSLLEQVIEADDWPAGDTSSETDSQPESPLEEQLPPLDLPEPDSAAETDTAKEDDAEPEMLLPAPRRDALTPSHLDPKLPEPLDMSAALTDETERNVSSEELESTSFEALEDEPPLPELETPSVEKSREEPSAESGESQDAIAGFEEPPSPEEVAEPEPFGSPNDDVSASKPEPETSHKPIDTPDVAQFTRPSAKDEDTLSAAERLADLVSDFVTPQPDEAGIADVQSEPETDAAPEVEPNSEEVDAVETKPEPETEAEKEPKAPRNAPPLDLDALNLLSALNLLEPASDDPSPRPSTHESPQEETAEPKISASELPEAFPKPAAAEAPATVEQSSESIAAPSAPKAVGAPLFTPRPKPIRRGRITGAARFFSVVGWFTFCLGAAFLALQVIPGAREAVQPYIDSAGIEWLKDSTNAIPLGAMVLLLGGTGVSIGAFLGRTGPPPVPLHDLVAKGDADSILEAVAQGKPVDQSDSRGHTPLHAAVVANRQDIVASLLDLGADIEARTHKGETPLLLAVMEQDLDMTEFLMEKGADVFTKNNRDSTLMHAAAWTGDVRLLCLLKQKKLWVNAKALTGYTPLHFAAQGGHLDAIHCLIDMDADVNAMSVKGNTPLYAAAKNGHLDAVEMLFAAGADPNIQQSQAGHSPLAIAMENGHHEVVAYLKNSGAEA